MKALRLVAVGSVPVLTGLATTLPRISAIYRYQFLLWLCAWVAASFVGMRLLPAHPESEVKRFVVLWLVAVGIVALFIAQASTAFVAMYFLSEGRFPEFAWFDEFMRQFTVPMLIGWFVGPTSMVAATALSGRQSASRLLAIFGFWFSFVPTVWLATKFWMLLGAEPTPKGLLTFHF